MPPSKLDFRGRAAAKSLIKRIEQSNKDWPHERHLRHLNRRTIIALHQLLAEAKRDETQILIWCPLISCYVLLFVLHGGPKILCILLAFCLLALIARLGEPGCLQRASVYALTQTDDMRVLGTLIEATRYKWGRHPEVFHAIRCLLEQVTEEHIGLLSNDLQMRLWKFAIEPVLTLRCHEPESALLSLQALSSIGNYDTLMKIQHIAHSLLRSNAQQRVVEAAQKLFPLMEARLKRQALPGTLLRSADMPPSQPETLLRASLSSPAEPADQLLRADTPETSPTDT